MNINDYSEHISSIIYDTRNYEAEPLFYLTQFCNLGCKGCYMRSSPKSSRDVLPYADLNFFLDEFDKVPNFTNNVTFSGGEIFSAPINYLTACSHMVLDRGWGLQLKTNGAWVMDNEKRRAVVNMLRHLRPTRGIVASSDEINSFLASKPKWLLRLLGQDFVRWWMFKRLPTASALSMAVSVDDVLHPAQSADWFINIVNMVAGDKKLRDKLDLKTFTLEYAIPLLELEILNNPNLKITGFHQIPGRRAIRYSINGVNVESYVGEFVDVEGVPAVKKLSEIVVPPLGDARGRLVYCFYPDGTVGIDCNYLESVGRVAYRDVTGKYKTLPQIQEDIHKKLVTDYTKARMK